MASTVEEFIYPLVCSDTEIVVNMYKTEDLSQNFFSKIPKEKEKGKKGYQV